MVGFGMDERIERVGDDTAAHHHHAHAADAAVLPVGGLEIYGGKVGHCGWWTVIPTIFSSIPFRSAQDGSSGFVRAIFHSDNQASGGRDLV